MSLSLKRTGYSFSKMTSDISEAQVKVEISVHDTFKCWIYIVTFLLFIKNLFYLLYPVC